MTRFHTGRRLGASGSFAALLELSEAPYLMPCDQDDGWLPDKVELTLGAMRQLEGEWGANTPLLVNTDLKVVDQRLATIDESFWHFERIHPQRTCRLSRVLMQNFATGCTVMINRALARLALPVPVESMMHDWWLALVAVAFGKVSSMPKATVLYRQHGGNDTGASRWKFSTGVKNFFLYRDRRRAAVAEQRRMYVALERQATAFATRYDERLDPAERAMLAAFCTLGGKGFFGRRHLMLKHGFLLSDRWLSFMSMVR